MNTVSIRDLLAGVQCAPASPDEELGLSSLQVVSLVERIEEAFDVRLTSRDITRKNFRTQESLVSLLRAKGCAVL